MANQFLNDYPIRRINPRDGMAVTAEIWKEAHAYHELRLRYHELFQHGWGIITGLEVTSDETSTRINVKPGLAIDSMGRMIVVSQVKSYQISPTPGLLYLILYYGESPQPPASQDGPAFSRSECTLQAFNKPQLPTSPYIEVARVQLSSGGDAIRNARTPDLPGLNELDLRFRPSLSIAPAASAEIIRVGVAYTTKSSSLAGDGHGAVLLGRALRSAGRQVWVDDAISLSDGGALRDYHLVNLVGRAPWQLSEPEITGLRGYVQSGGTLFVEPCRRDDQAAPNAPIYNSLLAMARSLGTQLAAPQRGDAILTTPHRFSAPPPGFEAQGEFLVGGGVIFSACDYGCLWQGERRGALAAREEIRSAEEWGENLLAYAVKRRQELGK